MSDQVILVNEKDEAIGEIDKMEAHENALLHRAFSIFIFNAKGEMLLQQRSLNKYHSGGLWTNACCSHPKPGEETIAAASRRLQEELGFSTSLKKIFEFTYRSDFENGLTEYEFDHVFAGHYEEGIFPDPFEVKDYCFRSMHEIESSLQSAPQQFTSWFRIAWPRIKQWKESHPGIL